VDPSALVFWRNVAAVILAVEAFIFSLPLLVILYFLIRGLRAVRAALLQYSPIARSYVTRAENVTRLTSSVLVTPPMRVIGTAHGLSAGFRVLLRGHSHQA
jgi:hypothetical protein